MNHIPITDCSTKSAAEFRVWIIFIGFDWTINWVFTPLEIVTGPEDLVDEPAPVEIKTAPDLPSDEVDA